MGLYVRAELDISWGSIFILQPFLIPACVQAKLQWWFVYSVSFGNTAQGTSEYGEVIIIMCDGARPSCTVRLASLCSLRSSKREAKMRLLNSTDIFRLLACDTWSRRVF